MNEVSDLDSTPIFETPELPRQTRVELLRKARQVQKRVTIKGSKECVAALLAWGDFWVTCWRAALSKEWFIRISCSGNCSNMFAIRKRFANNQ